MDKIAPIYWIIAGVNGAGKSTFYEIDVKNNSILSNTKRINPDEILVSFGGDPQNYHDQFKSGKLAVKMISEALTNKISFNQETTLAGASFPYIKRINRAKEAGFLIYLTYVGIMSSDLAKKRIAVRVSKSARSRVREFIL